MSEPSSDTTIHHRLQIAVGDRSFRSLSEITGVNHESVRRYMQGSAPSTEFLQNLCNRLGINGDWLLTGKGPVRASDMKRHALDSADANDLLTAMANTLSALIARVERLERYTQLLESHLQAKEPNDAQAFEQRRGAGGAAVAQATDQGEEAERHDATRRQAAERVARAAAKRPPASPDRDAQA